MISGMWSDVRHAVRGLRRSPGFALTAVAVLALGIGGTAVIFAVIEAVLLRPLPFPQQDRLVAIYTGVDGHRSTMSPPDFTDFRSQSRTLSEMAAMNQGTFALTGEGPAEQFSGAGVTGGFFSTMGVPPLLGRAMTPADDDPAAPRVAVLSYGLWQRRFGGAREVIGRRVQLEGAPALVIGVMPQGFEYPDGSQVWLPLRFSEQVLTTQRGAHYLDVIGRVKPGLHLSEARADLERIAANLAQAYPRYDRGQTAVLTSLRDSMVGDVRGPLFIVLGAVGLVLLIACANVAGLLLVRGWRRQRELAIRTALGAARANLIRVLLAESLVLAVVGGAAAVLLAMGGAALIAQIGSVPIPLLDKTRLDLGVLGFTALLALGTCLLFGLAPAWLVSGAAGLPERLKAEGRGASARRNRSRGALIVVETALAVLLLTGAGLLARSFGRLTEVDPGFNPAHVLTFGVSLPDASYPADRAAAFGEALTARLQAIPGAESAGAIFGLPLSGFGYGINGHALDGRDLTEAEAAKLSVQVRVVTPDFFRAMIIPIRRGRGIAATDRAGAPHVMVVNEAAARLLWPDQNPIGHSFVIGSTMGLGGERAGGEVVGVVGDVRDRSLAAPAKPTIYLSHAQFPMGYLSVAIRTVGDPLALSRQAQAALAAIDPDVAPFQVRSMDQLVASSVAQPKLYMLLLALFAVVAVLLVAVGLYGIVAQSVAQRRRELGIRLALGARGREVVALMVRQGIALVVVGLVVGLVAGLIATRVLRSLLFEVAPHDPLAFAGGALLLLATSAAACYLPARRATRVDPVEVLREE